VKLARKGIYNVTVKRVITGDPEKGRGGISELTTHTSDRQERRKIKK